MFLHGAFPASQRRLRNFGSGWFRVKKMTTKNGQEGFFTGKACKKIYGNRRFKLTIHLNISHDDYCIVDGTLCVAALTYKDRLDLLFMEPTSGGRQQFAGFFQKRSSSF